MDVLIKLYCFWLGAAIVLFFGFCFFIAIADESFCIVDKINIMLYEMFLQRNEVEVAESLIL